jgi:hypothetical protein
MILQFTQHLAEWILNKFYINVNTEIYLPKSIHLSSWITTFYEASGFYFANFSCSGEALCSVFCRSVVSREHGSVVPSGTSSAGGAQGWSSGM